MKIGNLLNKNRNRLGVFKYENAIKRHFYLSVKWQQNVSRYSASNRDDVSDLHYYALAFPVDVVVALPGNKLCHAIYSKERYEPTNAQPLS